MANESAPAEGHTVTLSITREQASARVGELPGEPIDKQDEGLAAPPMKVLADILDQLKGTEEQLRGTQEQLRGTQEQLKETLVHADREKLKFQKSAPQEIVDDFKTIYAQCGMAIPRELLNIAGYILTPDQHNQALAARDTEIMADA
ncbi:hypothetical protein FBULB1_2937 [Fusarium bulbicola]|nr:hypothetical protein FBULB1_2937 [Fusarium bulbicola]